MEWCNNGLVLDKKLNMNIQFISCKTFLYPLPLFFNFIFLKGFYIVILELQQIGSGKYYSKAFPTFCKNFILYSGVICHWPLCVFIVILQTQKHVTKSTCWCSFSIIWPRIVCHCYWRSKGEADTHLICTESKVKFDAVHQVRTSSRESSKLLFYQLWL